MKPLEIEDAEPDLRTELQEAVEGRFVLEREIGRGGMATVYLAQEMHPSRQVAIKVLDPDVTTRLTRRRFLREVELVSNLTHPHIVPIYSAGCENDLLYYVMPFIDGETLRHRIAREGPLPLEDTIQIVQNVADALDHAHASGIIHRDIKPENILLSGGHAVVADFGVARAMTCAECGDEVQPLTKAGLPIGTPMYMSPEQAAGKEDIDGRSDIYSLGCVTYEMLTGEQPFKGGTMYEIMSAHSQDPIPNLKTPSGSVPRHVRRAVTRAMAKKPTARFDTADEFARTLTGEIPATSNSQANGGRNFLAVAAVAVLMLLLAMFAITSNRPASQTRGKVVVAVFANQTGDPALDALGSQAADWITAGLAAAGNVDVVSTGRRVSGRPADGDMSDLTALALDAGADAIVWGAFYLNNGLLQFQTQVTSARDRTVLVLVEPAQGESNNPTAALEMLKANVAVAIATAFPGTEGI